MVYNFTLTLCASSHRRLLSSFKPSEVHLNVNKRLSFTNKVFPVSLCLERVLNGLIALIRRLEAVFVFLGSFRNIGKSFQYRFMQQNSQLPLSRVRE